MGGALHAPFVAEAVTRNTVLVTSLSFCHARLGRPAPKEVTHQSHSPSPTGCVFSWRPSDVELFARTCSLSSEKGKARKLSSPAARDCEQSDTDDETDTDDEDVRIQTASSES